MRIPSLLTSLIAAALAVAALPEPILARGGSGGSGTSAATASGTGRSAPAAPTGRAATAPAQQSAPAAPRISTPAQVRDKALAFEKPVAPLAGVRARTPSIPASKPKGHISGCENSNCPDPNAAPKQVPPAPSWSL